MVPTAPSRVMVAVVVGVGVGVAISPGVGDCPGAGLCAGVGVLGGVGVAESVWPLEPVATRPIPEELARAAEPAAPLTVEIVAFCTEVDNPPHLSRYAPQNTAMVSIVKLPVGGGVGSE